MEKSREILQENNIRPTKLRVKVLDKLMSSGKSFSFMEMHHDFEKEQDRVTIYRIFNLLYEADLLEKAVDTDGVVRYFYCGEKNAFRRSFRCRICGIMPLLSPLPDFYQYELDKHLVDGAVLLFSGTCEHCKNKQLG